MGPSGSGKTTLLNLLGGIDRPDGGSIDFLGARLETLGEGQLADWRARHVGFIFQRYHLLPMLSAAKNGSRSLGSLAPNQFAQVADLTPGTSRSCSM